MKVVKFLVGKGADIHTKNEVAFRKALRNGHHLEFLEYLVENDANIHAGDDYLLRYAAGCGHLEVAKF